ncbi:MAG: hypothetical protein PHN19_02485 [Patescibacteria group bacterium]|nr:hypothetical protein [Patescibacteria group bacterium]
METKKAIELIKQSDLTTREKNSLIKKIETEGLSKKVRDNIIKAIDNHIKKVQKGIKDKEKTKENLGTEIHQDKLVLDLIYFRMLKRMKYAYDEYQKGIEKLDGRLDSVFQDAVKMVEEDKKRRIKEQIK